MNEHIAQVAASTISKQNLFPDDDFLKDSLSTRDPMLSLRSFRMTRGTAGRGEDGNNARQLYCLPPGIATCYPRSVNRNIFYIIGVIVVIVVVLKVLHVF